MYKILSPRVGTVGDTFTPDEGTNVEALIEHGFISSPAKSKPTPVKTDTIPTDPEE